MTATEWFMKAHIEQLEKENKSLKDDLLHYIQREEEYRKEIEKLKIEIWWLMWERDGLKMVVEKLHKEIEEQDEAIKNLKLDLGYSRTLLDNVSAEYKSQVNINKKLKAELEQYKKQYEHSMWDDEEWWSRDEHSYDEIWGE